MAEATITDIRYLVESLQAKIIQLENRIKVLESENGILRYKLYHSEKENAQLRERLSRYESPKKDSHNSHIPPSQQDLSSEKIQRTKSLREKSNKPSGGQIGHQGVSLEFSRKADKTEDYLSAYCPECGKALDKEEAVLLEERWSIDIPPVVSESEPMKQD